MVDIQGQHDIMYVVGGWWLLHDGRDATPWVVVLHLGPHEQVVAECEVAMEPSW